MSLGHTISRMGPGILFASLAIGVSHLVQSTRAGADFGLSLAPLILLACALKYPLFRFSISYGAVTGESLFSAYKREGHVAVGVLVMSALIDLIISTAAVTLVTAGLIKFLLGLSVSVSVVGIASLCFIAVLLLTSSYRFMERGIVVLVLGFTLLVLTAAALAAPTAISRGDELLPVIEITQGAMLFVVAMMGWMPNPPSASFMISAWSAERKQITPDSYDQKEAVWDINIGYWLTVIVALAFLILGATLIFGTGVDVAASPAAFAGQLVNLFGATIGQGFTPLIAISAFAVMFSTLFGLMDGVPRVLVRVFTQSRAPKNTLTIILAVQVIGTSIMLLAFQSSFKQLIDFATSLSFIFAPLIAYYNYRAITSDQIPDEARPGRFLVIWNFVAIICFIMIAGYFLFSGYFGS